MAMADFADRVRIKASKETEALGLAGRLRQIYGWTTPSVTGVSVIGSTADVESPVAVEPDEGGEESHAERQQYADQIGHGCAPRRPV
jgi:hypothetical protein